MLDPSRVVARIRTLLLVCVFVVVVDFLSLPVVIKYSGISAVAIAKSWVYKPVMVGLPLLPQWASHSYRAWCNLFYADFAVYAVKRIHDGTLYPDVEDCGMP